MGIKSKITLLIISLTFIVTTSISYIFLDNLNNIINNNIKTFQQVMMKVKKQELENKMDLATHMVELYYKKSTPQYMEGMVEKRLIAKQQMLFSQLNGIYKQLKKNKIPQKEIRQIMLLGISKTKYGNNGYFWVNDFSYKMIMHPIRPQYNGKYFVDTPKVPFVELAVNALEHKNKAFISYKFYNPATKKYEFKVSLVRVFKPYDWIIGTGRYISDVTKNVQNEVIEDIKNLRYGNNGYFWINDFDYKIIMHPIKPEYDGKVFKNNVKVPFVELAVKALQNKDQAFISYKFYNPATKKYESKLSLVRVFKPWNWIIGTGTYLNDVDITNNKIKKISKELEWAMMKKIIYISLFILFMAILIGYYLTVIWIVNPMKTLDNSKHYFEEIATLDFLTQIINRRSFFEQSKEIIDIAKQHNNTICVIMLDIDFFKKINDNYGHEAGDEVLKSVTKKVSSVIREGDIFGRIGGEEFAILMVNCNKENLIKIAEKIRKVVEESSVNYDNKTIKCTISMGAYIAKEYENIEQMLKQADYLLYQAKNNGRNRVEINE